VAMKGSTGRGRNKKQVTADQCRAKADQFLAKARAASTFEKRGDLLAVAERWARLAVELDDFEVIRPAKITTPRDEKSHLSADEKDV
jgi:hypothetical protein